MSETDGTASEFVEALSDLKRRGSTLLVTGTDYDALDATCGRLLGEPVEQRRRLFVLAGGTRTPRQCAYVSGPAAEDARVVSYRTETRSAAASTTDEPSGVDRRTVDGGLADLQSAVADEVASIDEEANGLDAAELRICVDGVDSLLAVYEQESVFQFVHGLSGLVRGTSGMCHVHLPGGIENETVQVLVPLFDAVIEVRSGPQQRWHLREPELVTDWLAL